MGLADRLWNYLKKVNINSHTQIFVRTDAELLRIPGIGKKSLQAIHEARRRVGWTGTSIDIMRLSPKTRNALGRGGVTLCERLKPMSDAELLQINGIGSRSLNEIRLELERQRFFRSFDG
jgi:DNA-directed RNA polymerase alpha subunit